MEDARKLYWWSIIRGEEEIILGRGPRMSFDLFPNHAVDDPVPQRSRPTVEGVLTKAQFLSPLLYQIHYIGSVGFGFAHIYSKRSPPKSGPYNYYFVCELLFSLATLGHKNSHNIFPICRGGKLFMANNKLVFVADSHESQ